MSFKRFLDKLSSAASKLNEPASVGPEIGSSSKFMNKINSMMPSHTFGQVWNFEHLNRGDPIRDLFHFKDEATVKSWRLMTDEMIGGKSRAQIDFDASTGVKSEKDEIVFRSTEKFGDSFGRSSSGASRSKEGKLSDFILTEEERRAFSAAEDVDSETPSQKNTSVATLERDFGSMKFSGVLNLDLPTSRVERSGFAATLSPVFPRRLNLEHYDALELRLKTDGRIYVCQIKTDTNMDDDLYQAIIPAVKADTWTRVVIPFHEFLLTFRGYAEEDQIPLDPSRIIHIAILMAERKDGPFSVNIDWIRAVRQDEVHYEGRKRFTAEGRSLTDRDGL